MDLFFVHFCFLIAVSELLARDLTQRTSRGKKCMFTKEKLYGSGTLVLIVFTSIIWTTLVSRSYNCSIILIVHCQGVHFIPVFRCLGLGLQCSSIGRPGLNFQIIVSNYIFSQTSLMKSKWGIFMAPTFLNSLCTQ